MLTWLPLLFAFSASAASAQEATPQVRWNRLWGTELYGGTVDISPTLFGQSDTVPIIILLVRPEGDPPEGRPNPMYLMIYLWDPETQRWICYRWIVLGE